MCHISPTTLWVMTSKERLHPLHFHFLIQTTRNCTCDLANAVTSDVTEKCNLVSTQSRLLVTPHLVLQKRCKGKSSGHGMGRRIVECKWARSQGESNHNIGNFQSRQIPGGKVLGGFILGYCIVREYYIT